MNLRRLILACSFLVCFAGAYGQVGVNFSYFSEQLNELRINNTALNTNIENYQFNVHYELGLRNFRVNFLPGLDYMMAIDQDINEDRIEQTSYGVSIPVRAYVLSIEGDCNCPTFSQSSNFFSKGFFFELYPAIRNFTTTTSVSESDQLSYLLGLGAGLDIGLSDQFTLSVVARTGLVINQSTGDDPQPFSTEDETSSFNNIGLELKYYFN